MNTLPRLTLFLLIGIVSCSTPERNAGKVINAENSLPNKHDVDTVLVHKTVPDIKSNIQIHDTLLSVPLHSKKKRIKIVENHDLIAADFNADEKSYIISGFSKNKFTKNGKNIDFARTVNSDEDKRVGCSGGQKDLSFTIVNAADTFLVENEMLKSLNFKYHIVVVFMMNTEKIHIKERLRGCFCRTIPGK